MKNIKTKELLFYNGHMARIYFSNADKVFFGKLIDIKDLVIFEGACIKKLKQAMKKAVNDYQSGNATIFPRMN